MSKKSCHNEKPQSHSILSPWLELISFLFVHLINWFNFIKNNTKDKSRVDEKEALNASEKIGKFTVWILGFLISN